MKTIAFIYVSGGSRSISLKNIKLFCGKPLIFWSIDSLNSAKEIDEIIVATDSDEIKKVVNSFGYKKVSIFHRSNQNAIDTALTEDVMLEYLEQSALDKEDIFILVQANYPLTESKHFTEALSIYQTKEYDSLLTCVRNYRFYWKEDGSPINYDYNNRPEIQSFNGCLMENGAFYINRVKNIKKHKNRLSGTIGIYEMPEYTGFEIDKPENLIILENLMRKNVLSKKVKSKVKLFLCDVDGVMTDAGMYYSENGDEMKKFNAHDGMAMQLLRSAGIKTGIITSENSKVVVNRAKKIGVDYLYQGKKAEGKLAAALEICEKEKISLEEIVYIGDDINCFELLSNVGYAYCPADAVETVKNIQGITILQTNGGNGAIRELADMLLLK